MAPASRQSVPRAGLANRDSRAPVALLIFGNPSFLSARPAVSSILLLLLTSTSVGASRLFATSRFRPPHRLPSIAYPSHSFRVAKRFLLLHLATRRLHSFATAPVDSSTCMPANLHPYYYDRHTNLTPFLFALSPHLETRFHRRLQHHHLQRRSTLGDLASSHAASSPTRPHAQPGAGYGLCRIE